VSFQAGMVRFFGWCNRQCRPYAAGPTKRGPAESLFHHSLLRLAVAEGHCYS
jgi:hypothetical protein